MTAAQFAALGMAASTVQRRARQGGPWHRVLPGTYLVSNPPLRPGQRLRAATLFVGSPSAFTGRTALTLYGVSSASRVPAEQVHLLIPHDRKRTSHGFVHVERTFRWPDFRLVDGFPVAPPARAAIDACRRMSRRGDVAAVLADVVNAELATVEALAEELRKSQRRRSALAREVLAVMSAGPVSPAEVDLYRRWTQSALPAAQWNVNVFDPSGRLLARPDVYLPASGVVVEVDSMKHHFGRDQWDATMRRHAAMTACGLLVIHVPPARIVREWDAVCAEVRAAVTVRGDTGPRLAWRSPMNGA